MADIKKLEARRQKIENSEEWQNFKTVIDNVRWMFNPDSATLQRQVSPGTKLNQRRVSSTGILLLNDYACGVLSETITANERWFELYDIKNKPEEFDLLDFMGKKVYETLTTSNFSSEMYRDKKSSGCDGTSCMYVERIDGKLSFRHIPFGSFWFVQDFNGMPDLVWIEQKTTVGALVGEFGIENVSNTTKIEFDADPDKEICIIYYCGPRRGANREKDDKKNKPYEFLVYEKAQQHLLEEGGVDMQKFRIYREKRVGNETLGRGPAIDAACSMYSIERCSKDLQRALRLGTVPMYAVAASMGQNGFRIIHEDDASIMIYDDTGIASPPQAVNPQSNVEFGQTYLTWQIEEMRRIFYLDYFNPVMDKKNITAYQTREIATKSQQMVDQITGPFIEERLNPMLKWTLILLGEAGEFAEFGIWKEIQAKLAGRIGIRYTGKLANAQKRLRLGSIMEYMEASGMIAQGIPDPALQYELLVSTDYKKLPTELIDGTNAPKALLRDKDEVNAMVESYKESMAQAAQMENAVKMADAAAKGGKAPEQGSPTAMQMGVR